MEDQTTVKNVLEQYLKALHGNLNTINQFEKSRIKDIVELNNVLSSQLQVFYPESSKLLVPVTSDFMISQQITSGAMQACHQSLTTKLQQIRNYTDAMEQRIKEEAKRFREAFNGILYSNDTSVMPYYDVEAKTNELEQSVSRMAQEIEEGKQKAMQTVAGIQNIYTNISQDIANMEVVKNELSFGISNLQNAITDKLSMLALEPTIDVNTMSSKAEDLRNDISEIEAKLKNTSP